MRLESITRPGIDERFPKTRNVARNLGEEPFGTEEHLQEGLAGLARYAAEGCHRVAVPFLPGHERDYDALHAGSRLSDVATTFRQRALAAILTGKDGFALWRKATAYEFWHERILCLHQAAWLRRVAQGAPPGGTLNHEARTCASVAGLSLALGWTLQAGELVRCWLAVLDQASAVLPARHYNPSYTPTDNFVLRLVADAEGWERPVLGFGEAEDLYGTILEHWREPDPAKLCLPLLAVCDRHTHQSRHTGKAGPLYDLSPGWAFIPFEVLTVLALRKGAGLANPELDHPVMNTPLGQLRESGPLHADDLLDAVLARAREEYPDL